MLPIQVDKYKFQPQKGKQGYENHNIVELLSRPTLDEELQVIAIRIMGQFKAESH